MFLLAALGGDPLLGFGLPLHALGGDGGGKLGIALAGQPGLRLFAQGEIALRILGAADGGIALGFELGDADFQGHPVGRHRGIHGGRLLGQAGDGFVALARQFGDALFGLGRRRGARLVGGVGRGVAPLALHHGDALAVFLFQPLGIGRHHRIDGGAHAVHLLGMLGLEAGFGFRDQFRLGVGIELDLAFGLGNAPVRFRLPLCALGGKFEIGGLLPEALRLDELVGDADARLLFHGEHLLAQFLLGLGDSDTLLLGDLFRRCAVAGGCGCPLGLGGTQALGFRGLPSCLGGGQLLGNLALDDGGLLRLIVLHLLFDQREAALGLRLPGDVSLVEALLLR